MSTVIESLPAEHRDVITALLAERGPELLSAFQTQERPTLDQRDEVSEILADAFSEHLGPGYEPTEQGVLIDNALGAFLTRWPTEALSAD